MNKLRKTCLIFGVVLIAAALVLSAFNLYDSYRAGEKARTAASMLNDYIEDAPHTSSVRLTDYRRVPGAEMPAHEIEGVGYIGKLDIPQLGLSLPVADSWSYDALSLAPCRYSGSVTENNLVICAHNYGTHFGRLSELSPDSQLLFTDCEGNRTLYRLADTEELAPEDIERMTDSGYDLTLFTCNWNGTARFTLRYMIV